MKRTRRAVGALAVGSLVGTAGCIDFVLGDDAYRFEATEARVEQAALEETGYAHQTTGESEVVREVEAAGQSREIEAVNVVSEYDRRIDIGPFGSVRGAVFTAFATPKAEVLGRTFNPIDDMSNRQLASELQSNYENIAVGEQVDERTIPVLDDEVEFSKFEGQAVLAGQDVDVFVHLGTADGDGDFVVPLGIYPQLIDEEAEIVTLSEAIEQQ